MPPPGGGGIMPPGGQPPRQQPPGRRQQQPGGEDVHMDLEDLAPIPDRPLLFPPDSKYYLVPITFEIVLRDQSN
jgi:hypothetical protein